MGTLHCILFRKDFHVIIVRHVAPLELLLALICSVGRRGRALNAFFKWLLAWPGRRKTVPHVGSCALQLWHKKTASGLNNLNNSPNKQTNNKTNNQINMQRSSQNKLQQQDIAPNCEKAKYENICAKQMRVACGKRQLQCQLQLRNGRQLPKAFPSAMPGNYLLY